MDGARGETVGSDQDVRPFQTPAPGSKSSEESAMRILSWNIAQMKEPWRLLLDMDVDLALLQEVNAPLLRWQGESR